MMKDLIKTSSWAFKVWMGWTSYPKPKKPAK